MCTPSASDLSPGNLDTVLHPLDHQVGGHTQLMLLDQGTVCKPLIQRELLFYLRIPNELRPFVPNYKGVVQVRQVDGCPIIYHPIRGSKIPCSKSHGHNNCSSTTTTATNKTSTNEQANSSTLKPCDPSTPEGSSLTSGLRFSHSHPELRVQLSTCNEKRILAKDLSSEISSSRTSSTSNASNCSTSSTSSYSSSKDHGYSSRPSQRYFLLLENIASQFHLPCILDLKMGTRQHGDDASAEKRSRQMAKCAATTSASLGVRLGGMQVYREDLGVYLWRDKYFGRKLDEDGLKDALTEFFHNGQLLRTYAIAAVINRLRAMKKAVEQQQFFRFYSTSLLIAYEGCTGRRSHHHHHHHHHHHPHHPHSHHHPTHEGVPSDQGTSASVPRVVPSRVTVDDEELDDGGDSEPRDEDTGSLESFTIDDDDDDARFYAPMKQNNRSRRSASQQLLSSVSKKSRHHTSHSHSSSGDDEDSSLENSLEFATSTSSSTASSHSRSFSGPFSSSSPQSPHHPLLVSGQMKYRRPDRRWQYQCSRSDCHRRSSPLIDVRMIDFAHAVLASPPWNSTSTTASTTSSSSTTATATATSSQVPLSPSHNFTCDDSSSFTMNQNELQGQPIHPRQGLTTTSTTSNPTATANSTSTGTSSSAINTAPTLNCKQNDNIHEGPDEGFLKGLNSLIRLLSDILENGRLNGQDEMDDSDIEVDTHSTSKEV